MFVWFVTIVGLLMIWQIIGFIRESPDKLYGTPNACLITAIIQIAVVVIAIHVLTTW